MKSFITPLLLLLLALTAHSQKAAEYRVVRVVGIVEDEVTKKALKTNDHIPLNRKLKFATNDAHIVVISPETGRFTIAGVPNTKSFELLELLEKFVRPDQKQTGSRSGAIEYLEQLQSSVAFDTLLILSPGYFPINTDKLSLTAPAAIKAWYYQNRKVTYRKISDASGFKLDQKSIFEENAPTPLPRIIVEYFEDENHDPMLAPGTLIGAFVPLYADEEHLIGEIRALASGLPTTISASKKVTEIRNYLSAEYATPQEENLKHWLVGKGLLNP
jgi:hypothetical protein